MQIAPRYSQRLLDVIEHMGMERVPIAEINRRVGAEAERLGCARPSYERVRELVHLARDLQRNYVSAVQILFEVTTLQRSPRSADKIATLPPLPRLRDHVGK